MDDTVLSMVAAERYPRMVILFLDHGARINSRNDQGRTPLMEAALWGQSRERCDSPGERRRPGDEKIEKAARPSTFTTRE